MVRSSVATGVICLVCGVAVGQPATAPEHAAPQTAAPATPAQPDKPVPVSRPRPEHGQAAAPSGTKPATPPVDVQGTGENADLRPRWTKGDTAKYDFEFMSRWTAFASEGEVTKKGGQLYRQEGRMIRRVLSVDDAGVTLSFMMERLHVQVSSGTEVVHYDSEFGDDPNRQNDLTAPVKMCVGRPITVRISRAGEVLSVEGNENPEYDATKPDSAQQQVPQAILGTPVIKKLWRPLFSIEKKNLESHVGDKWVTSDVTTDPGMGTFELTIHNELTGVKDGVAHIDSNAEVLLTPAVGPAVMGSTLTSSTVTGTVEWNCTAGILKTWETNQEMKLDTARGGEKQKLETKVTTSFKFVDPNAPKDPPKPGASGEPAANAPQLGGAPAKP